MPSRQGIVELTTARRPRAPAPYQGGARHRENPMTRGEVDAKSYDLIAPVIGKARARKLCDAVWSLEQLRDVCALRPLLRA